MVNVATALDRALEVYMSNKYFVLATKDDRGPWAAALAHTFVEPSSLCFFSQRNSRHGKALLRGENVAGVIYNSQCAPEEAESIQFAGLGSLSHDRKTIGEVLAAGNGGKPVSEEVIDEHLAKKDVALFKVEILECWVLDQEAYKNSGIDAREAVEISALFAAIRERH